MTPAKPITAAEALGLARQALEDDARTLPGPWTRLDNEPNNIAVADGFCVCKTIATDEADFIAAARTREPQLARFVEAVLGATMETPSAAFHVLTTVQSGEKRIDVAIPGTISPVHARSIAAALLRAADVAEGK